MKRFFSRIVAATLSIVFGGCDGGTPASPPVTHAGLTVDFPAQYRAELAYGTITIHDGAATINLARLDADTFAHLRNTFQQAYARPATPMGDTNVTETAVTFGGNSGFKYAIHGRGTVTPIEVKYLLRVGEAYVSAEMSAGGAAFVETKYEPILGTLKAK
jgi:hypothetical protein